MTRKEYDQAVRKVAQSDDYPCPDDFDERMHMIYERLPDDTADFESLDGRKKTTRVSLPYFRYGLVAASIACLLLVIAPASASLQGYWKRMAKMTDTEKRQHVSDLERYSANEDSFSRALTASEWDRMRELIDSYEQDGDYPTGEVEYVGSGSELQPGQIGFCAENSTFYLPESELTDEQLLEIIDFQHKRAYSLAENGGETTKTPEAGEDNGQFGRKAAVAVGEEWIQKIYGECVSGWENTVEHAEAFEDSCGSYEITFREKNTSAEYWVSVRDTDGKIFQMACSEDDDADHISTGLSVGSKKSIRKQYKEVKQLAEKFNGTGEIVSASCEYLVDKKTGNLPTGTISFWLTYKDGTGLWISYSLNSQQYFQYNYIENMAQENSGNNREYTQISMTRKVIQLQ